MTSQIKTFALMAILTMLFVLMGSALGGSHGLLIALVMAVIMNGASYWFSDSIVLRMYHAQDLAPQDAPLLHRMVEELARRAGLPKPRIVRVPMQEPNAFATGRDPEHSVIAVTDGIMHLLPPEQLVGVLGHEMAHIAHRDILIQSIACVMGAAITSLANMLQFSMLFGRHDEEDGRGGLGAVLMMILAPLAATLIQMAISRRREYMADATGAQLAGDPLALAKALNGLDAGCRRIASQANPATESMFIVSPFSGNSISRLFSTHPPMEDRIARLQEMARTGRYPE